MQQDPISQSEQKPQDTRKVLSLISHKIKTPLSIINGYSEAILSQAGKEKFSPFTSKALEEINKQGNKLCHLIDKLFLFNKVENLHQKDLAKKSIPLKNLLKTCANDALTREEESPSIPSSSTVSKRGTFIEIDCPPALEIKADEELMAFLLEELMVNAIKFNNKAEKTIKVQCTHHGDNVSISVRDYGFGIRPQDEANIFEPFYQVDDYFTGQVDGWGLGLPIVKRIVELHGGSISVISDRGLGSVFTIRLPVV